jgi:hypothetical protein
MSILLVMGVVWVYGGSKTAGKISAADKNLESIKVLQNRLMDEHDLVVNDLDSLFGYSTGETATGIIKSTGTITTLGATTGTFGSIRDTDGARHLSVTKRYTVTAVGSFDTTKGNTTAQGIVIDSLPTLARLVDAWVINTQGVFDEADTTKLIFDLSLGTAASGHQIMDSVNCDTVNEIGAMSVTEAYDLAPAVTRTKIYLTGYPAENWTKIFRGIWNVYINYINNTGY